MSKDFTLVKRSRRGRILDNIMWLAAAAFTVIWLQANPGDFPLALVVWSGGVLSVGVGEQFTEFVNTRLDLRDRRR